MWADVELGTQRWRRRTIEPSRRQFVKPASETIEKKGAGSIEIFLAHVEVGAETKTRTFQCRRQQCSAIAAASLTPK